MATSSLSSLARSRNLKGLGMERKCASLQLMIEHHSCAALEATATTTGGTGDCQTASKWRDRICTQTAGCGGGGSPEYPAVGQSGRD